MQRGLLRLALLVLLGICPVFCDEPADESGTPDVQAPCFPSCVSKECGSDGCGGQCGTCGSGLVCESWQCVTDGPGQPVADVVEGAGDVAAGEDTAPDLQNEGSPGDEDGDQIPDPEDNCPADYNPSQLDADQDGEGDLCDTDDDNDGDPDDTDCESKNPSINHDMPEACDGVDNNCDGFIDEGFPDNDSDGAADCADEDTDGDGESNMTDCQPLNPDVHHKAEEECDSVDNNCNGVVDEEDALGCLPAFDDLDQDGWGVFETQSCLCNPYQPGKSVEFGDCDDNNPGISPVMMETCDGLDNDCDDQIDEGEATGCVLTYVDNDGDGWGLFDSQQCLCNANQPGLSLKFGDCDDNNPDMSPDMTEMCDDKDNNCSGVIDEQCDKDGDDWCNIYMPVAGNPQTCPNGPLDCNDDNALIHPGMDEIPNDGMDNDCDGDVDEGGPLIFACPANCTGQNLNAYLCSMEMCFDQYIVSSDIYSPTGDNISSAWNAVSHFGSPNNDLSPWAGNSYALLASGPATGTSHSTDLPGGGSAGDPFSADGYNTHDNVEFKVVMIAPPTAIGFSLDYIYMSEEYEEYIGSVFNDKFYMILKAPQTTNNVKKVINHTACSNPNSYHDFIDDNGEKQCYIAINTAFSEPCSNVQTSIAGTGFQCGPGGSTNGSSTGWLTTSWPIQPNETFELIFHIHDTSDGIYDSEVVVDNFQWLTDGFEQGTKPHPNY